MKYVGLKWVGGYSAYAGGKLKNHPTLVFEEGEEYFFLNVSSQNNELRDVIRLKGNELSYKVNGKKRNLMNTIAIVAKEDVQLWNMMENNFHVSKEQGLSYKTFIRMVCNDLLEESVTKPLFYNGDPCRRCPDDLEPFSYSQAEYEEKFKEALKNKLSTFVEKTSFDLKK